jgi:hypothetical protein
LKLPFQLKLNKKTSILGMAEAKTWILLANYDDQSLLRNSIVYKIGAVLGMDTCDFKSVDLYIDGKYQGIYLLCEKVQIQENRVNIYDLEESIIASGLPMLTSYDEYVFESQTFGFTSDVDNIHFKRACKLADTPQGSGHSNFLSGIVVSMNITATVKWWEQFQRYHFKQITSSMSTMHRLRQMMQNGTIKFNKNTAPAVIAPFMDMVHDASITDEKLAYSCPMGLELTARITTNYLQLKTIKMQRKNHRLQEWKDFCAWIDSLPFAKELIG